MSKIIRNLMLFFAAGALGGFANAVAVWGAGAMGITAAIGVDIAPDFAKAMIYSKIVWGGIWGSVFILPHLIKGWPIKPWWLDGIVLSILPSINTLFFLMPSGAAGMMGLNLGALTPLFVLTVNAIWGVVAMLSLRLAGKGKA